MVFPHDYAAGDPCIYTKPQRQTPNQSKEQEKENKAREPTYPPPPSTNPRDSSGMAENRRGEASSNWPSRCATPNWCLASSPRLTSSILSSRALATQNPSQSQIRSDLGPLTSLPNPSQSSSIFPLLLQLLLDFVPPLHAEGVTSVLQTLRFDLERHYLPL